MKLLEFEALDGSKWVIPASVVIAAYQAHYGAGDNPNDAEIMDWARNDMNWADVKDRAVMTDTPDPLDMEDSWANGKLRVIEGQMPNVHAILPRTVAPEVLLPSEPALSGMVRAASEPGDFPSHYACKRCGETCAGGEAIKCARGPCPMELVAGEPPAPAPPTIGREVTDSLAKYLANMALPNIRFSLNAELGGVAQVALRLHIDAEGVSFDVTDGLSDADAVALFMLHTLQTAARQRDAAKSFTRPDLIALYNAMKSEDVLAGVEPGDHGDAILEAYARRVIAAVMTKVKL